MFKPVDLLSEVYEHCIKDKIRVSSGDIIAIVKDNDFYNFECDIKIVTSEFILEETIRGIEKEIDDYCLENYNFVPPAYGMFPQKVSNLWLSRVYLTIPLDLFPRYMNYLKLKNDTSKMKWDFKYLC